MRVSHEGARGCGYRKGGGLYLVSAGVGQDCELLPVPLEVCGCCGQGIKPARGWTWVNPDQLLPHHAERAADGVATPELGRGKAHPGCPLNEPGLLGERAGLLWIGGVYYATPGDWIAEGQRMGFSRRIGAVPKGYEVGQWVLVGHRQAVRDGLVCTVPAEHAGTTAPNVQAAADLAATWPATAEQREVGWEDRWVPGVFHLWRPERIEYVVKGTETADELAALEARGIEPVKVVPVGLEGEVLPT